jgi:UDP-N-acetylmuramate--alanine ligase
MQTTLHSAQHIHLTGFKGVAMASIAQCLHDMGKTLSGSDVAEQFVTHEVLQQTQIQVNDGFNPQHIPPQTNLLIYTAAHKGPSNPEVTWAVEHQIPVMSQAQALAELFNAKKGIAVCGVGGKSTTSAMITWIFSKLNLPISFSVGVGSISGLTKTGQWSDQSEYFIAEADEYVIDPSARIRGEKITPRFSFLKPQIIVCTYLAYDHPDVYGSYEETKQTFLEFFINLKENGSLVINGDQPELVELADKAKLKRPDISIYTFGMQASNDLSFQKFEYLDGKLVSNILLKQKAIPLTLEIPGKHNLLNACAAILACDVATLPTDQVTSALSSFHSTQRRFEYKGEKNGVIYFDDYAHHPRELSIVIQTLKDMYPHNPIYIAFQPHTFSRTRSLFDEFVEALGQAPHLLLAEIFPSAREAFDPSMNSKLLFDSIRQKYPACDVVLLPSLEEIAKYCQEKIQPGSVCMTVGAGDIYQIHDKMS